MDELIARTAKYLAGELGSRPLGTEKNENAQCYLRGLAEELGYTVQELPFECHRWEYGSSFLRTESQTVPIYPGPFSPELCGEFDLLVAESVEALRREKLTGKLLLIRGALSAEPLMPRDFPFYYPEEHREIIDLLREKQPAGVIAFTDKHPLCGLDPYPLFEDGNLGLPNGYAKGVHFPAGGRFAVELRSASIPARGRQLIFSRKGASERRVVLCAHLDTKYETPGALDNAAGVATITGVMERLAAEELPFSLDVVPFNGEEQYEVSGQLAYLAHRNPSVESTALVVNLDGLGHRDSVNAFSSYNLTEGADAFLKAAVFRRRSAALGAQWIAGDHSMFAFQGIPCVAVTSSNLMETVLELTHTSADTLEELDLGILEAAAETVAELIRSWEE